MTLLTDHGVELSANEQVFLLFAALNAAGYAEEPKRKGPPLNAPVYHPIRVEARDALRKTSSLSSMEAVRKVFETHAQPIPVYIEAALSMAGGAPEASAAAKSLARDLAPLSDYRTDAQVVGLYDKLVNEQRDHMKALDTALETDFEAARKVVGDPELRAPTALVVVPNPLDGHGLVRKLGMGGTTYLVVGPGLDAARSAVLVEALRPAVAQMVDGAYGRGKNLARSWSTLSTSKRITSKWPNGKAYLTDALTHAIVHRARSKADGKGGREADEAFVDAQAKDGMRWSRAALRILDSHDKGALAESLPGLVARATP